MNANLALAQMTAKGMATMQSIGNQETSFFDGGIVEGSGIWGECLASELGHKSSGVINRLVSLGLLTDCGDQSEPGFDAGHWYTLTAVGAEVANILASGPQVESTPEVAPATVTVKRGRKWTYVYDVDGSLIAEIQNDAFATVGAALGIRG